MENTTTASSPATSKPKQTAKRRKRRTAAQILRDQRRATAQIAPPSSPVVAPEKAAIAPVLPAPPSPAALKLQEQVVELVSQRSAARKHLSEAHAAYLLAQSTFQAAEANVKAAEQDAQYLLGLIAQLENRSPVAGPTNISVMPPPNSLAGVTSEPSTAARSQVNYAVGSADDLRREMRGMM